jgi:hypothetical protein
MVTIILQILSEIEKNNIIMIFCLSGIPIGQQIFLWMLGPLIEFIQIGGLMFLVTLMDGR